MLKHENFNGIQCSLYTFCLTLVPPWTSHGLVEVELISAYSNPFSKSKSKYRYVGKIVWDITPTFEGEWGVFFAAKGLMTYQEIWQIFKNLKFRGDV